MDSWRVFGARTPKVTQVIIHLVSPGNFFLYENFAYLIAWIHK